MPKLPHPSLIIFDLDNTLYDYVRPNTFATATLIEKISFQTSLNTLEVKSALDASRLNVKQRLGQTASSHNRLLYISEVYRLLNLRPDAEQLLNLEALFWDSYLSQMELFTGVVEFIQLLGKHDISLALLTDLTSNIQYRKLVKLGLSSCFDFILTSEEAGGDKSLGFPFELLSKIYAAPLSSAWFIGDGEFDCPEIADNQPIFFRKVERKTSSNPVNEFQFQYFDELRDFLV